MTIHHSIICNSKILETTQMSINREVVEYIIVYEVNLHFIASKTRKKSKINIFLSPLASSLPTVCIMYLH